MSNEPIPFRTREQRDAIRKGIETRARRHQLLALAQKQPSFERWTAADLEKLFWDVWEWVRALSERHPNAPLVYDLEERITAEYKRRHQETPMMVEQRKATDHIEALRHAQTAAQAEAIARGCHLTLVPKSDEPDPAR